jgi:hypothetical protein
MTPPDAARLYISRGLRVVPIPPGQKGPRAPRWQNLMIGLEDVPQHFTADSNIGVLLGPASGELVDIDLDCLEALELADRYLPPTEAMFGRASKPRSHRLYVAPGAVFETFGDPLVSGKNTLLELRAAGRDGGGHQTVFPPSLHPEGERIEWHGAVIAPAVVQASVLRTAAAWLAVGSLVRRHVSAHASERPGRDLPDLLDKADPKLGETARGWLKVPGRTARTARLRPRREMSADDIDLAELVAAIPNDADWDRWNAMGLAIYAATGGSDHGAVVFDDWSAKSAKYNPYVTADRWRHFHQSPPSRTGIGKLVKMALGNGWRRTAGDAA